MVVFATVIFNSSVSADNVVPVKVASKEAREVRVFLKTQRFGFYEKGQMVFWGVICSGRKGLETPKGKHEVLMKAQRYFSRKYDGASMPFAVQFTTGGHFLHVGEIRPKPSSHGCVRLCEEDAKRIFRLVKLKDPVIVTD
jgi:lipoprotein-anchoring transpeptidase ErfK/SrfK